MLTPWKRILIGAVVLLVIGTLSVIVYHFRAEYTWTEAIWLVVVGISTVGFSEKSQMSPDMQLFSALVIVLGVTAAAFTFGSFVQFLVEGEIENILGRRRMSKELDQLTGHVVLCGFGRTGDLLVKSLMERNMSLVVVDYDEHRIEQAKRSGVPIMKGDATNEDVLRSARIEKASAVITNLPSDADNVFITLTARNLCPAVNIIARAQQPSTAQKLRQAGANRVVQPAVSGARMMARMVTRPSTAELMELLSESSFSDVELDEFTVTESSGLVGMDVRQTEAHRTHGLLVVAVHPEGEEMVFNPDADYRFAAHDTVMIMGRRDDILSFQKQFNLSDPE